MTQVAERMIVACYRTSTVHINRYEPICSTSNHRIQNPWSPAQLFSHCIDRKAQSMSLDSQMPGISFQSIKVDDITIRRDIPCLMQSH